MTFKPLVLGGQRRGRRPVWKGEEEEIERHSIPSRGGDWRAWGRGSAPAFDREVRHHEEEDEMEAPGAGRLHSGKVGATPGVGGAQAGWAGKGREEAQRGKRGAGRAEKGRRPSRNRCSG
jgi:hypothetical protein